MSREPHLASLLLPTTDQPSDHLNVRLKTEGSEEKIAGKQRWQCWKAIVVASVGFTLVA